MNSIFKNSWLLQRKNVVKHAFTKSNHKHILVLGYSFSDVFDINPVIQNASQGPGIPFVSIVDHQNVNRTVGVQSLTKSKFNQRFNAHFKGHSIMCRTNEIIKILWAKYDLPTQNNDFFEINNKTPWSEDINSWKMRMLPAQAEYIMAALYFTFSQYDDALQFNKAALIESKRRKLALLSLDLLYQKATIKHRLGGKNNIQVAKKIVKTIHLQSNDIKYLHGISKSLGLYAIILLHNEDKYIEAERSYYNCLAIQEKTNDLRGQAITWLSIGSCLRHQEKYAESIQACKRSLQIRLLLGDVTGVGRCCQGIGNNFLDMGNWKEALKYFKKFVKISNETDDKWAYGTACYKIAECLLLKGDKKSLNDSLLLINQSIEIRKNNLSREYANVLFLKAQVLSGIGMHKESFELHKKVLEIREYLKDHLSDIADSYFQLGVFLTEKGRREDGFEFLHQSGIIYYKNGYKKKLLTVINTFKSLINNTNKIEKNVLEARIDNLINLFRSL